NSMIMHLHASGYAPAHVPNYARSLFLNTVHHLSTTCQAQTDGGKPTTYALDSTDCERSIRLHD
ncbi:MAG: hypothetical protein ACKPKO_59535, partial [Candidatus Fonsibacter sp.]